MIRQAIQIIQSLGMITPANAADLIYDLTENIPLQDNSITNLPDSNAWINKFLELSNKLIKKELVEALRQLHRELGSFKKIKNVNKRNEIKKRIEEAMPSIIDALKDVSEKSPELYTGLNELIKKALDNFETLDEVTLEGHIDDALDAVHALTKKL